MVLPGQSGSRPDHLELTKDDQFGYAKNDARLGRIGTEINILGGRSGVTNNDSDNERYLTKGDTYITVGRSVDVEAL